jgi:hypothetical protein
MALMMYLRDRERDGWARWGTSQLNSKPCALSGGMDGTVGPMAPGSSGCNAEQPKAPTAPHLRAAWNPRAQGTHLASAPSGNEGGQASHPIPVIPPCEPARSLTLLTVGSGHTMCWRPTTGALPSPCWKWLERPQNKEGEQRPPSTSTPASSGTPGPLRLLVCQFA